MIPTKFNALKIVFVALALICLMASQAEAGKMTRSKTPSAVAIKSAAENATINPNEMETEDADAVTTSSTVLSQPADEKQTPVVPAAAAAEAPAASSDDATTTSTDSFSIWSIVSSVWKWIRDDLSESLLGADDDDDASTTTAVNTSISSPAVPVAAVEGRTFGKIRRLQMALIPIIFKFGVLSAMVAFLLMIGMKTVFLLKVLVLMNAAAILGKFFTLKTNFGHFEHIPAPPSVPWGYSNWNPYQSASHGWSVAPTGPAAPPTHPSKEIHLHIHGAQAQPQAQPQVVGYSSYGNGLQTQSGGWERRSDPYRAYDSAATNEIEIENELNNQGPIAALPTKYPANHRY